MSGWTTTPAGWTTRSSATWRSFLRAATAIEDSLDRQLQRDAGMPHAYYQVLAMLSEAPDRTLRMSQLAELTTSPAAGSRTRWPAWRRRAGYAGSSRPTGGERSRSSPTTAGTPCGAAAPGHVAAVRAVLFDRLAPGQTTQLRAICERLTDGSVPPG